MGDSTIQAESLASFRPENPDGEDSNLNITVYRHGTPRVFSLPLQSTLQDLTSAIEIALSIPVDKQKLLISPKPGLQKHPFPSIQLSSLPLNSPRAKITLIGSTTAEINAVNDPATASSARISSLSSQRAIKPAKASPRRDSNSSYFSFSSEYTFHRLLPLAHLPNPSRSLAYLTRLRDDPGIRAAMRAHHFSVPLLTEMDPAEHTTVSSRTLGLNRNKGEVIELRLRTDAYDGYRDYRTIRKTLCHELAHCVHGEHDRDFWNLTSQIEQEVDRADYWASSKGRRLTDEEFYNPSDWEETSRRQDVAEDHGGWTGGEFVLGGLLRQDNDGERRGNVTLSRREILARAAEERVGKAKQTGEKQSGKGNDP